jgi:hypothetical protein
MSGFRGFLFCAVLSGTAACATAAFPFTDFGQGRPVTREDLSGRSFCSSNGVRALYGADRRFSNSRGEHNVSWSVPRPEARPEGSPV